MEQVTREQFARTTDIRDLNSGSVFGALSADATRFLLENGTLWQVAAGESVFEFGDPGNSFFVVCRGGLDFYREHEGARYHTRSIGFGEEVGFVAMIALHDHIGAAVAHEDSVVLEINTPLFHQLYQRHPQDFGLITLNLARDLARAVRKLGDAVVRNAIDH